MRLIDADTLIEDLQYDVELDARALDNGDFVGDREFIQFDKDCKQNCVDFLRSAPTVEPTLYGYNIEHLALIARVMQKEGVTPERAVQIFGDVQAVTKMVIDEINGIVERTFEQLKPTIDPVKHGRWIDFGSGQECTQCHEKQYGYDSYRFYCPHCGAKMDGENDAIDRC